MRQLGEYSFGHTADHAYWQREGEYVLAYYKVGSRVTLGKLLKGYGTYVIRPIISYVIDREVYTDIESMIIEENFDPDATITIFRDTVVFMLDKDEVLEHIIVHQV